MFNLPFPTDSLYKFAFMFGLVLIVFSFYYRDNHLNYFDKTQGIYKVDSLEMNYFSDFDRNKGDFIFKQMKTEDLVDTIGNSNVNVIYHTLQQFYSDVTLDTTETLAKKDSSGQHIFSFLYESFNDYKIDNTLIGQLESLNKSRFKDANSRESEIKAIDKLLTVVLHRNLELMNQHSFLSQQIKQYRFIFWLLFIIGVTLFLPGTLLWFFLIQKPQDRLLKLQLEQIEKQNIKLNTEHSDWEKNQIAPAPSSEPLVGN